MMAMGCRSTASENSSGTSTLPSSAWMIRYAPITQAMSHDQPNWMMATSSTGMVTTAAPTNGISTDKPTSTPSSRE